MWSFLHTCRIRIEAPIGIVWDIVADPSCWPEVNDQILRVDRPHDSHVEVGETFTVTTQFESGDPTYAHDWVAAEVEPENRVAYVLRERGKQTDYDQMTFSLEDKYDGTVILSCHLPNANAISWRTMLLLLFFVTPAKVVRDSFLKGIRRLALKRVKAASL